MTDTSTGPDSLVRALTGTAEAPELVFRRRYGCSAATLRAACTEVERLARWFGRVDGNPTAVGDPFTALLSDDPGDRAEGTVLRCTDDGLAVSWSWQGEPESVITVRVVPLDDGASELVLHHELRAPEHAVGYGGGWEQALQALARALGVGAPDAAPDEAVEATAVARWRTMAGHAMVIEQHVPAPPERVWWAFTTPAGLARWWWRHWDDVTYDVDPRVGGGYRILTPGAGIGVEGRFVTVEPPHRLAFSWRWLDDGAPVPDEAVDVALRPVGDGTLVRVRHTGPWTDGAPAESYREGWASVLGVLSAVLAGDRTDRAVADDG